MPPQTGPHPAWQHAFPLYDSTPGTPLLHVTVGVGRCVFNKYNRGQGASC